MEPGIKDYVWIVKRKWTPSAMLELSQLYGGHYTKSKKNVTRAHNEDA